MRLVWDAIDARWYEVGVDSGVFYPPDGIGVVWNGLVSVDESGEGGELTSYFLDGVQYLTVVGGRDYQAKVTALSAPREFASYTGDRPVVPGVFLTGQPKPRFNFSYRTQIADIAYRIHLVYNVLASIDTRGYETTSDRAEAEKLAWTFDATPVVVPDFEPSAHLVVDSSKVDPEILSDLEALLYGTIDDDPTFPPIEALLALFGG